VGLPPPYASLQPVDLTLALLAGLGIAAAAGLRAFLPLLALGLAGRFELLTLRPEAGWLSSDVALWALGFATVLEIVADKVPVVDHALDAVGTVLRPAAAWLGAYALLGGLGTPWAQLVALVFGAGALAIHSAKAHARIGSTATTLGFGNPVLSFLEDALAFLLLAVAILLPLLALVVVGWFVWRIARRRRRAPPAGAMPAA
jgi:hypothetical protein